MASPCGFAACMQALALPEPPAALAVAVSGGADSTALALLAKAWADTHNIPLTALTVDHGLRAESADEAVQVAAWMASAGISHTTLTWEKPEDPTSNLQATAREVRYRLMADYCQEHDIQHLLLAQHLDDQAETFLIRLGRGSGADGLSAMQPISQQYKLTLLRPLLGVQKTQLVEYLQSQNQPWIEDPSNADPAFMRVQMRKLLPLLHTADITAQELANTANRMARARDFLEQETKRAFDDCITENADSTYTLQRAAFADLHPEIGLRVLAELLKRMSGETYRPRFTKLGKLYAAVCRQTEPNQRSLLHCQFTGDKNGHVHVEKTGEKPPVVVDS